MGRAEMELELYSGTAQTERHPPQSGIRRADPSVQTYRQEITRQHIEADKAARQDQKYVDLVNERFRDEAKGYAEQQQKKEEEAYSAALGFNPFKPIRRAAPGAEKKAVSIGMEKMISDEIGTRENFEEQGPIINRMIAENAQRDYQLAVEKGKKDAAEAGRKIMPQAQTRSEASSGSVHGGGSVYGETGNHRLTRYLTKDEADYYYYLAGKDGIGSADAWLKEAMPELSRREMKPYTQDIGTTDAHTAWGTINSIANGIVGGLIGFADDTVEMITKGEYDPYSAGNAMYNYAQAAQAEVMDLIPNGAAKTAYQLAVSIAQSSIAGLAGLGAGGAAAGSSSLVSSPLMKNSALSLQNFAQTVSEATSVGLMAAQAAEAKLTEAYAQGLSPNQSYALGLLAGVFEALTEKYSVDALFADNMGSLAYLLKNMATEGSEEGASNLLNYFADAILAGDNSELRFAVARRTEGGESVGSAILHALLEHLPSLNMDVLGGIISGLAMAGPASVQQGAVRAVNKLTDRVQNGGLVQEINTAPIQQQNTAPAETAGAVKEAEQSPYEQQVMADLVNERQTNRHRVRMDDAQRQRVHQIAASIKSVKLSSSDQLTAFTKKFGIFKGVKEYLQSIFNGLPNNALTLKDGKLVIVDNTDIRKLSHNLYDLKAAEIEVLNEIVEKAQFVGVDKMAQHRKFDEFHYYVVPVEYNGQTYEAILNIGHNKSNGGYHLYEILNFGTNDEGTADHNGQSGTSQNEVDQIRSSSFNNIISQTPPVVNTHKPESTSADQEYTDRVIADMRRAMRGETAQKIPTALLDNQPETVYAGNDDTTPIRRASIESFDEKDGQPISLGEDIVEVITLSGEKMIDFSNLPGSKGITVPKRLTDKQMEYLTQGYGVEFAQVFILGIEKKGRGGKYIVYSGDVNSVIIPVTGNTILINHTHPGGTAYPSNKDKKLMELLAEAGSPQITSSIIPVGKESVKFTKEGLK